MTEIIRNRTIRPSSRLEKSKSYKIDTKQVSRGDILIVNIDHESNPFKRTYRFNGGDVASKDSISFRVNEFGTSFNINWSGAQPIGTSDNNESTLQTISKLIAVSKSQKVKDKNDFSNLKHSFDPISDSETKVLILGTMPGDKSLELGEYYGHSRNRFWKIISTITNHEFPINYEEKKSILYKTNIGIWDVAHKARRKGSLDSAIESEEPNDITGFISKHKNLKMIAFNGAKAESLFNKYFSRTSNLKYISLPSTSPANTGIDFENSCRVWKQILIK